RLLRIVPAYWLVLTVLLVFSRSSNHGFSSALIDYAFLQVWAIDHGPILSGAWTPGIEGQFYLLLPILVVAFPPIMRRAAHTRYERSLTFVATLLAVTAALPLIMQLTTQALDHRVAGYAITVVFPHFLIGMMVALLYVTGITIRFPAVLGYAISLGLA